MEFYSTIGYYENSLEFQDDKLLPVEDSVLIEMLKRGKDKERRTCHRNDGILPIVAKMLFIDPTINTRNFYVLEVQDRHDLRVSIPGGHVELAVDAPELPIDTIGKAKAVIISALIRESFEEIKGINSEDIDPRFFEYPLVESLKKTVEYLYEPIPRIGVNPRMQWYYYFDDTSITIFVPVIAKLHSKYVSHFTRGEFLSQETWRMRNPGMNKDKNDIRFDSRYRDYVSAIMNTKII